MTRLQNIVALVVIRKHALLHATSVIKHGHNARASVILVLT